MAAAQADAPVGSAARLVAVLYEDTFQLIVHKGSSIRTFADLRGRRVGLARSGGQYQSFVSVAEHFEMTPADCTFVGADDEQADRAFLAKQADAVFRVRALGNPAIVDLVRHGDVEFVPIDQAQAMRIKLSAFRPSTIPQGAYLGAPPIPPSDLVSVGVQRTLHATTRFRKRAETPSRFRHSIGVTIRFSITRPLSAQHRVSEDTTKTRSRTVRPAGPAATQMRSIE